MHLIQIPRFLEVCYEAKRVPFLWGPKGIGKSDGVAQGARAIGKNLGVPFGFVDLRLGSMEVGDLIGIPRAREVTPGVWRTVYAVPDWFPIPGQPDANGEIVPEHGIVFCDEFNRAGTNDVIQAMFQFILGRKNPETGLVERYLHTHRFPTNWSVVAAGNPDTADYVVQAIDTSMLDRLIQVVVDVEKKVATSWMRKNLQNKELWKFVQGTRESLGKPEACVINVTPSARSYEFIDDMLAKMNEDDFNDFGLEVINGIVGETVGTMLYKHLKNTLLRPMTAKEIMDCKDFDELVKERLTKYISKDKNHLELIDITLTEILEIIKEKEPTVKQANNVVNFLNLLPRDLSLKFYSQGATIEKFIPIVLALMDTERNDFTMELMLAMGYPEDVIKENLVKLEEIVTNYEKDKEIQDKTNSKTKS